MKRKYGLMLGLLLVAFTFFMATASAYTVVGNSVLINDSKAYIRVTPHTMSSSGYVTLDIMSKTFTGNLNFIFGFNTSNVIPKSLELYNPHNVTTEKSYTCDGTHSWSGGNLTYWFNATANYFWCWQNVTLSNGTTTSLVFSHSYDRANVSSKTAYWNENTLVEWTDIAEYFDSINYNYDGKNKWYYAQNVPVTAGTIYKTRMYVNIPSNSIGKYDFAVYPSAYGTNLGQAISDGNLYLLDPWFNTSKNYKVAETINFSNSYTSGIAYPSNVTGFDFGNPSYVQSVWGFCQKLNCTNYWYYNNNTDYQLVNSTENGTLPFEIERGNGTSLNPTQVWNNATSSNAMSVWHLTNLNDSSGNSNALTAAPSGVFANSTGFVGGSYWWNGTNAANLSSAVPSTSTSGLSSWRSVAGAGTGQLTVIAVILPQHATKQMQIYDAATGGCGGNVMTFYVISGTTLGGQVDTSDCNDISSTGTFNYAINNWYFVAMTYQNLGNGSDTISMYGGNISSGTNFRLISTNTKNHVDGYNIMKPYYVGGRADSPLASWVGNIDEVRTYNRTMSLQELNATYLSFKTLATFGQAESQTGGENFTSITIQNPTSSAYFNNSNVTANYTISTNVTLDTCGYKLNALANVTLSSCQNFTFIGSEGSNTLVIYVNNTNGGYNSSSVSFTIDTISPSVSIQSPTNSTYTITTIDLNYTASDANIDRCTRELNGVNSTLPSCANTTIVPAQGNNLLKVYVNDTLNHTSVANVSFFVDSVPPNLTVQSPTNTTYVSNHTLNLNYTAVHSPPVICSYKFDGGSSIPLANCINTTFSIPNLGQHNVNVSAADTYGNTNISIVYFTVINNAPTAAIQEPVNQTYYNGLTFNLNYTAADVDLDKCIYNINGGSNTTIPSCANTTFNVSGAGFYTVTLYVNDSWNNITIAQRSFTLFQGVNISARLANGTNLTNWNVSATNGTNTTNFTITSNPNLIMSSDLPQGLVIFNATKAGFDSEVWNTTVNNSMGVQQHNFTLYPFSNVTFFNTYSSTYLSAWYAYTSPLYFNDTVSGTTYTFSNRLVPSGTVLFYGFKTGYQTNYTSVSFSNSTGYNIQVNTSQSQIIMYAVDEQQTGQKHGFNAQFITTTSNITVLQATAYRRNNNSNSPNCWDGSNSTACLSMSTAGISPTSQGIQIFYGQDYNNASYYVQWAVHPDAGAPCEQNANLKVYINGILYYTDTIAGFITVNTYRQFNLSINNWQGNWTTRTLNFTAVVSGERCSPYGGTYNLYEFSMINNSAGYQYVDDNTITIPSNLYTGFDTVDIYYRGEETYETNYTQTRMLRASISQFSNYNIVGYLLRDTLGYLQNLIVLNTNNIPIPNALITINKWFGSGTEVPITQCVSSIQGACALWVEPNTPLYSILAQASGYQTNYTSSIIFTGTPNPAYVYMQSGATINFTSVFNNILVALNPQVSYLNYAINTSCQVIAGDGNLNYINFTVYRTVNSTIRSEYNSSFTNSQPSGGTLTLGINNNGRFDAVCIYEWVSNATGATVTYKNQNSWTYWIYSDALDDIANESGSGFGGIAGVILAVGVILLVAAPIAFYSPPYGLAVGIFLLLIFSFLGMLPWYIGGLAILAGISALVLKSGL